MTDQQDTVAALTHALNEWEPWGYGSFSTDDAAAILAALPGHRLVDLAQYRRALDATEIAYTTPLDINAAAELVMRAADIGHRLVPVEVAEAGEAVLALERHRWWKAERDAEDGIFVIIREPEGWLDGLADTFPAAVAAALKAEST